jgi:predicted ferric reductase
VYAFLGGIAVVAIWWRGAPPAVGPGAELLDAGRLVGLLAGYVALVQVLLRARLPALTQSMGMRRINAWHRLLGGYLVALVVSHATLITAGYAAQTHSSVLDQFGALFTDYPWVWAATVGAGVLVLVAITSTRIARKRLRYKIWRALHIGTYGALVLAFFHQTALGEHFLHNDVLRWVWTASFIGIGVVVAGSRWLRPLRRFAWGSA